MAKVTIEGNTARKLPEVPGYVPPVRRRPAARPVTGPARPKRVPAKAAKAARAPRELSDQAKRNRERAMGIGKGYVLFLAGVCVMILLICVNYLRLQTQITGSMKAVAALESELTQLREDNDAYYSQVTSNVDLTAIKKIAIGRLGMRIPKADQIMTYETEGRSYLRQFQDVPGA